MKRTASNNAGISGQRGFWLRCFLGRAIWAMLVCFAAAGLAWGQLKPQGPLQLWHLHGIFVTPEGKPLQNVEVTLLRDGTIVSKTRTDDSGRFEFDHVYGRYRLHIDKLDYSELNREVSIGTEVQKALLPKMLYVIAGPKACADDCSSVFTSKSEFERAIRRNTAHHY